MLIARPTYIVTHLDMFIIIIIIIIIITEIYIIEYKKKIVF